jgi:ribosomal protein S18 acetylase RimI-like enzyme
MSDLAVTSAKPAEFPAVLNLLFRGFTAAEQITAASQAVRLLATAELDPGGLLAAHANGQLVGAMLSITTPGAVGLIWPPQALQASDVRTVEDALIGATHKRLRLLNVKLAQALLHSRELPLSDSLIRNGYRHITRLLYHRRWLDDLAATDLVAPDDLTFRTFRVVDRDLFTSTLRRTYVETLDCPEVEGARTIDEVMAGYQAQAGHDPNRWWVALQGADPIGAVLANASPEEPAWEIVYAGIVPERRGRGLGRSLVRHALIEARLAGVQVVALSVDCRNEPALRLYHQLGFALWDEREVLLATL